jgi:hypothetical protein
MRGHQFTLALAAAVVIVWTVIMAVALTMTPPPTSGRVFALFPPSRTDAAFAAIIRSGGRPIDRSWAGLVWAVDIDPGGAQQLMAEGAIAVLAGLPLAASLGCAPVSVVQPLRPF